MNVVIDMNSIASILSQIEGASQRDRELLDSIIAHNKSVETYSELVQSKNLPKMYSDCADDYARTCYLKSGIMEALIDLRTVRKELVANATIPQSIQKQYKYRIESMIENLEGLRDAVESTRQGLEARVRFYNSCTYTSFDRAMGAKC